VTPVDWSLFPCGLGDVVVRTIDGAEAWAGGAIVLREDAPVAALLIAPDATGEHALYVRPRPLLDIGWLVLVRPEEVAVGREPPSTLEIGALRFERRRRLPMWTQTLGTGTPGLGGTAILGEYASADGKMAVVLVSEGTARVWRGERLAEGAYEVWTRGADKRG
jgi:hypothetical protein